MNVHEEVPSLALPLNVVPIRGETEERIPTPSTKQIKPSTIVASDISSPHELTAFVSALFHVYVDYFYRGI